MNPQDFSRQAERLTADTVDEFVCFYAPDCEFTDPFQTVRGKNAVAQVYRSMFANLDAPRFKNVGLIGQPSGAMRLIGWDFEFALKAGAQRQTIPGVSLLELNGEGLIARHTDYWDASRLMQSLPIVGGLIGWLRRKIAHA